MKPSTAERADLGRARERIDDAVALPAEPEAAAAGEDELAAHRARLEARRRALSEKKKSLLAKWVRTAPVPGAGPAPIPRRGEAGPAPLSFAQQRLWFLHRLEPGAATYNVPVAVRLSGTLDRRALGRTLAAVVRRHESLRTIFTREEGADGGGPVQVVGPPYRPALPLLDLRGLPAGTGEEEALRRGREEIRRPFDLARGPLLRCLLIQLAAEDHLLVLTQHHIVSDGWSMGVFLHEIKTLYGAFTVGATPALPELLLQYPDYAVWQRQWLSGERRDRELAFWRQELAGAPTVLELPTDHPRSPVQSARGRSVRLELRRPEAGAVGALGRSHDATLFMTLLAAFMVLLHRYSGQGEVLVGSAVAGRDRPGLEGLIGFFVNTLVLRGDLRDDPPFAGHLDRVRETVLAGWTHQELPFETLVQELAGGRDLGRSPLFQVAFTFRTDRVETVEVAGLSLRPTSLSTGTAKFDLTLEMVEEAGALVGDLEYNADLFDATTAARMAGHLETLLAALVATPGRPVSALPLLTRPERAQLLVEWNDTGAPPPGGPLVHQRISALAARHPEAPAVVGPESRLTYRQLEVRSNRLARHLRSTLGVGPEVLVAICGGRTVERVVGMLGVLKAGGAYVSVDPSYPQERLTWLVHDAGAAVMITEEQYAERLPDTGATVLELLARWKEVAGAREEGLEVALDAENLAYVVYTSGSTGKPKGVEVSHRGLLNLVSWHQRLYGVTREDRGSQLSSPAFDASNWEVWPYLAAGAAVHIPDEETRLSPRALMSWWGREGITLSFVMTPLAERVLEEGVPPAGLVLRALLTGGDRLRRRPAPEAPFKLMNHYGPAESTVISTVGEVAVEEEGLPAIGRPIDNVRAYVLSQRGRAVPVGVPGELCVGGLSEARGYHRRPAWTAERFVPDGLSGEPGGRLYRTGDRVRLLPDGRIDFLGRVDHQMELRGIRIEPGEIESALEDHPEVETAAVVVREIGGVGERLLAYVVPPDGASPGRGALQRHLAQRLPAYMIPTGFVELPALPLTPNGKLDVRALPAPGADVFQQERLAPRNAVEEVLAALWAEALGLAEVGVRDEFFALGGHSLLATRLVDQIRKLFRLHLPLRSFFEATTVERLARLLVAQESEPGRMEKIARLVLQVRSLSPAGARSALDAGEGGA